MVERRSKERSDGVDRGDFWELSICKAGIAEQTLFSEATTSRLRQDVSLARKLYGNHHLGHMGRTLIAGACTAS